MIYLYIHHTHEVPVKLTHGYPDRLPKMRDAGKVNNIYSITPGKQADY